MKIDIQTEKINPYIGNRLAVSFLKLVEKAFQDPQIQKEFTEWQKKQRKGSAKNGK